jgi:hypothetical protein
VPLVDTLTRSGGAKLDATAEGVGAIHLRSPVSGYPEIGLQPYPILAEQISRADPRYSAKGHHIFDITARPPAIIGD